MPSLTRAWHTHYIRLYPQIHRGLLACYRLEPPPYPMAWQGISLNLSFATADHMKHRGPDRGLLRTFHVYLEYKSQ